MRLKPSHEQKSSGPLEPNKDALAVPQSCCFSPSPKIIVIAAGVRDGTAPRDPFPCPNVLDKALTPVQCIRSATEESHGDEAQRTRVTLS